MDLEQQIRDLAARGICKTEATRLLGFTPTKMREVCSVIDGLSWTRSMGVPRGKPNPDHLEKLKGSLSKAREVRVANARRTVRGITGTVDELCAHFDVTSTPRTVRQRMSEGMTLEQALFAGQRASKIRDWSNVVFPSSGIVAQRLR